jgi:hypothetical protein
VQRILGVGCLKQGLSSRAEGRLAGVERAIFLKRLRKTIILGSAGDASFAELPLVPFFVRERGYD